MTKFCPIMSEKANTEMLKQCTKDCALYLEKLQMCSIKAIAQTQTMQYEQTLKSIR